MSQKSIKITGWILTSVLALLFTMGAFLKLSQNEEGLAQAASIGIDSNTWFMIGLLEMLSLILFIVPRTGVLGALLLIAYMGGAIVTHLQHQQPIAVVVLIQIVIWITTAIRFPELLQRLLPALQKEK